MTDLHIQLPDELGRFIAKNVELGHYRDASAVVQAALHSLELEEEEQELKDRALQHALEQGLASGIAEGDVFARVRRKVRLPAE